MAETRAEIVAWVGRQIVPHEPDVRVWLKRKLPAAAVDDVVQEAYCRIAALPAVAHIANGRAYFFRVAGNVVLEQARRARVVSFETAADTAFLDIVDEEPSPERVVSARVDLALVRNLIGRLPDRCRQVFELRRLHGVSQREVAARLGVSENVVEQQSIRGLRLVMKAMADENLPQLLRGRPVNDDDPS